MRKQIFNILLAFLLFILPHNLLAKSPPPGEWQRLVENSITVFFEEPDRVSAEALLDWYETELKRFADLLELKVPERVFIYISPTEARFKYMTRGLPHWTGGVVYPSQRTVVLKSPRLLPGAGQFKVTALHEGVHLLTELDGESNLPKWLAEGLAMYLSGETMYKRRSPMARAVVSGRSLTLEDIDGVMQFGPERAKVAYLQSISMVEFLVKNWGWESVATLVHGYRDRKDPDELFKSFAGRELFYVEAAWHKSLRERYRWWMLLQLFDFDMLLWGGASMFVVFVGGLAWYRKWRDLRDVEVSEGYNDSYFDEGHYTGVYYEEDDD